MKKLFIVMAVIVASFSGVEAEAASQTVTVEYDSWSTSSAIQGCKVKALQSVPSQSWAKIVKYINIFVRRNHCEFTCVVEYE